MASSSFSLELVAGRTRTHQTGVPCFHLQADLLLPLVTRDFQDPGSRLATRNTNGLLRTLHARTHAFPIPSNWSDGGPLPLFGFAGPQHGCRGVHLSVNTRWTYFFLPGSFAAATSVQMIWLSSCANFRQRRGLCIVRC